MLKTGEQTTALAATYAPFAPTMVVEALSPATAERDVGPKFAAYEEHGVKEYWILDPEHLAHRFYRRDGELLIEFASGASRIQSANIPGFWVERAWLDPANLPAVSQCLEILNAAPF